jgi:flavonol synthase
LPADDFEPVLLSDQVSGGVEDYLKVFARPDQVTAWREGRPYVAVLAASSAGR